MIDFLGACLGMLRSLGSGPGCHTCETGPKVSFGPQQQPSKRKKHQPAFPLFDIPYCVQNSAYPSPLLRCLAYFRVSQYPSLSGNPII
jgi:hypothetical protein